MTEPTLKNRPNSYDPLTEEWFEDFEKKHREIYHKPKEWLRSLPKQILENLNVVEALKWYITKEVLGE